MMRSEYTMWSECKYPHTLRTTSILINAINRTMCWGSWIVFASVQLYSLVCIVFWLCACDHRCLLRWCKEATRAITWKTQPKATIMAWYADLAELLVKKATRCISSKSHIGCITVTPFGICLAMYMSVYKGRAKHIHYDACCYRAIVDVWFDECLAYAEIVFESKHVTCLVYV